MNRASSIVWDLGRSLRSAATWALLMALMFTLFGEPEFAHHHQIAVLVFAGGAYASGEFFGRRARR